MSDHELEAVLEPEDFRDHAVVASQRLLTAVRRELGADADPLRSGLSLCIPAEEDPAGVRRFARASVLLGCVGGFGLLGIALILGPLALSYRLGRWNEAALAASLAAFVLGIGALIFHGVLYRWQVRRHLASRLDRAGAGALNALAVGVENAATFTKLKLLPEDLGLLTCHPDVRYIQIEGLGHRYLIYAQDVVELRATQANGSNGVGIAYRIGEEVLGITLTHDSILAEVKRQTFGGKPRLLEQVCATLDLPPATSRGFQVHSA